MSGEFSKRFRKGVVTTALVASNLLAGCGSKTPSVTHGISIKEDGNTLTVEVDNNKFPLDMGYSIIFEEHDPKTGEWKQTKRETEIEVHDGVISYSIEVQPSLNVRAKVCATKETAPSQQGNTTTRGR